ncbi:MAG: MBOAT family O-acyltransferase [Thermodesulfovibrionales bacterium]
MVFSSVIFLFFFLPIVLSGYFLIRRDLRNMFLLAASLVFYFWGEGKYVLVMVAYMVFNYYFAIFIEKQKELRTAGGDRKAKAGFIAALSFNLGVFVFYKYFNFVISNINQVVRFAGHAVQAPSVHLPIGISFFTFQALSYVIDVYKGDVKAQRSLINFSMYKALFPQLIAGPIVRYKDVAGQIADRVIAPELFFSGVRRFIIGLGKKVIIANTVASVADQIFRTPSSALSPGAAWLGALCYALQIYFDFSGYSDMAIGLGRMFGFHFLENFNYPYISRSIREFWRRWHISLSTWFRDYLYIPLGGNRVSPYRAYLNLLVVFFLCGLWHGASWTFVIWGLWHGVFLSLERTRFGRFIESAPSPVGRGYTLLVVLIGWVFFRSETVVASAQYLKVMFGFGSATRIPINDLLNVKTVVVILCGLIGSTPTVARMVLALTNTPVNGKGRGTIMSTAYDFVGLVMLFSVLMACIVLLSGGTYNPFIYFRF